MRRAANRWHRDIDRGPPHLPAATGRARSLARASDIAVRAPEWGPHAGDAHRTGAAEEGDLNPRRTLKPETVFETVPRSQNVAWHSRAHEHRRSPVAGSYPVQCVAATSSRCTSGEVHERVGHVAEAQHRAVRLSARRRGAAARWASRTSAARRRERPARLPVPGGGAPLTRRSVAASSRTARRLRRRPASASGQLDLRIRLRHTRSRSGGGGPSR